jgi:mRNA-degrading endonuclease RelE of RelBE toxin-antitoxin system
MFQIELTPSAVEDLRHLKRAEQSFVLDAIEQQLSFEPTASTRNRKALRENELSEWELRIGDSVSSMMWTTIGSPCGSKQSVGRNTTAC